MLPAKRIRDYAANRRQWRQPQTTSVCRQRRQGDPSDVYQYDFGNSLAHLQAGSLDALPQSEQGW